MIGLLLTLLDFTSSTSPLINNIQSKGSSLASHAERDLPSYTSSLPAKEVAGVNGQEGCHERTALLSAAVGTCEKGFGQTRQTKTQVWLVQCQ
eukprot:scaffold33694_cov98-Cyclotella_meneghiniana.AAC.4